MKPSQRNGNHHKTVAQLRAERRRLGARLAQLDSELAERGSRRGHSSKSLDRWLDGLRADLPKLPPLPADFSRADLYDDHD